MENKISFCSSLYASTSITEANDAVDCVGSICIVKRTPTISALLRACCANPMEISSDALVKRKLLNEIKPSFVAATFSKSILDMP